MTTPKMTDSVKIQEFPEEQHLASRLPRDLVDMIVSYIYDFNTLLSCSKTCHSWYFAVLPSLHYSLTTSYTGNSGPGERSIPLQESYGLGLLSLAKRFSILTEDWGGSTQRFRKCNFGYFSALQNLRELRIDNPLVPSFVQNVEQYLDRFPPAVESLSLSGNGASCRQILYLIGLFKGLQDFKLCDFDPAEEDEVTANLAPFPRFVPPLRGWLTLRFLSSGEEFLDGMVAIYGRLRFRCVDLWEVGCMQRVLGACTDTLETLQLHEDNPYEAKGHFINSHSDSAISRCTSLRTLRITAAPDFALSCFISDFLKTVLSAIASPLPLDLVIVYEKRYFPLQCDGRRTDTQALNTGGGDELCARCYEQHLQRFRALSEAHQARRFRLVLCADVPGSMVERAMRTLERHVEAHKHGELGRLLSELSMISTIPRI